MLCPQPSQRLSKLQVDLICSSGKPTQEVCKLLDVPEADLSPLMQRQEAHQSRWTCLRFGAVPAGGQPAAHRWAER